MKVLTRLHYLLCILFRTFGRPFRGRKAKSSNMYPLF
jgi:hypothetical protein